MGKIKEFTINLNEGKNTYFAGEEIGGNVLLNLAASMQMLRLIVFVEGKARCTNGETLTEHVINKHVTLFGIPSEASVTTNTEHPSGVAVYPFSFQLPDELPSSAQESNGDVKYKITARIIFKGLKGLISKDWKVITPISIKEIIDGNTQENQVPVKDVMRRTPGLFTKKTNLHQEDLLVTLEHSMYCPGEDAKVAIRYKDVNARKMGNIKSRLNKYVLFNPKENKRRYASRKIVKEVIETKKQVDRIYQRIISIPIPETTPPTNVKTKAIKLNYTIHIKVDGYPELKLPLTIGTKPLLNNQQNAQQAEQLMGSSSHSYQPMDSSSQPSYQPIDHTSYTPPYIQSSSPTAPPYVETDVHNTEWTSDFVYPPEYIPENEFDVPPSYEDAIGFQIIE